MVLAIVILVAMIAVFGIIAIGDRWDANRVNAFAAWATGLLTLAGVSLALFEAAAARRDAEIARAAAELDAARREWELERQRHISLEIQRRIEGSKCCSEMLDIVTTTILDVGECARRALFNFDDESLRGDLLLDLMVNWARAKANIGARVLPICDSTFAHKLADTTMPAIEKLVNRAQVISRATDDDELLSFVNEINDIVAVDADELRERAIEDFVMNMTMINKRVDESFPKFEEWRVC